MGRLLLTVSFVVLGLMASGCFWFTPKAEGEALRADLDRLEDRTAALDTRLAEDQTKLAKMIEDARAEVARLEETSSRATQVMARNSADFGADMEALKDRLNALDGKLAELEHGVAELGGRVDGAAKKVDDFGLAAGLDLPVDEARVPKDPAGHLQAIRESLAQGRYGEARSLARLFREKHPKHDGVEETLLLEGRAHLEQKRWAKALGVLRQLAEKRPDGPLAPEALTHMARAFMELGVCTDARLLVETVTTRHPKSPFAEKARALGEEMKKPGRCP